MVNWKTILLVTVLVLSGLWGVQLLQAPETILDDVLVFEEDQKSVLQLRLNLPVRYESHFPTSPTDFVQIKVRAVSLSGIDKNEYIGSESILPGFLEQVPLSDIAYEGKVPNGPYISLRFREPVSFTVQEDADLKGLLIFIEKS